MPTLSVFYGIKVMIYWMDGKRHHRPHIHVKYAEYSASVDIQTGNILAGDFPPKKLKLVQAWIEIHQDELMTNWELASGGQPINKIEPLT